MKPLRDSLHNRTRCGAALIIVLAFVVLLAGLVVAFFSNSLLYRQISNSSANQAKVDLFAQGAVDALVGDLKQEIAAGSNASSPAMDVTIYPPRAPLTIVPNPVGTPTPVGTPDPGLVNLVKRSAYDYQNSASLPFYANPSPAPSSTPYDTANFSPSKRAAGVSSLTPSLNGRSISPARWNKHLLLKKASAAANGATDTNDTDFTPVGATAPAGTTPAKWNAAPDWIFTARDGSNPGSSTAPASFSGTGAVNDPSASNKGYVIGRYAYAVYDEGSLLDANVAGFPASDVLPYTPSNSDQIAASGKSAVAFADLTQLPGINALSPTRQQAVINSLVGWRNYATAQPGGTLAGGYTYSASQLTKYSNGILGNLTGFLQAGNTDLFNRQTDRLFASRQEMMRLLLNGIAQNSTERANLQNALQYLGTFSRELNQPSYIPAVHSNPTTAPKVLPTGQGGTLAVGADREINPSYQTVRVTNAFKRSDGVTPAVVGEPLVDRRFPLQRLAWLTYKGPSAGRPASDPDIKALTDAGIPYSYLQLGDKDHISASFGMRWDPAHSRWVYDQHNNFFNGAASTGGPIMRIGRNPAVDPTPDPTLYVQDLAAPRDPDFFELLKSAITVGSLGKALLTANNAVYPDPGALNPTDQPYNYGYGLEASVDHQVMQIGANIINQFRADNFPVQIDFDDRQGNRAALSSKTTITGVANLPYLYSVIGGMLQVDASKASDSNNTDQLPRSRGGGNKFTGALGSGTGAGSAGYQKGDKVTSSGAVALMEMPVVWNPHDPSSSQGVAGLSPTRFRVVADSTTPDQTPDQTPGGIYNTYFVYGYCQGCDIGDGKYLTYYSYQADEGSPGSSWYRDPDSYGLKIGHQFRETNTEIDFTVAASNNNRPLFPEPTILMRPGAVTDSNQNAIAVSAGAGHLMRTDPAVSSFVTNGGLKCAFLNPLNMQPNPLGSPTPPPNTPQDEALDAAGTSYLGFYLGAVPMSWLVSGSGPDALSASSAQSGCRLAKVTGAAPSSGSPAGSPYACYLTYRMQYEYPAGSGNWVTYDTKYSYAAGPNGFAFGCKDSSLMGGTAGLAGYWSTVTDPRTSRFGLISNYTGDSVFGAAQGTILGPEGENQWNGPAPAIGEHAAGWLDTTNGVIYTDRPDAHPGYHMYGNWPTTANANAGWMAFVSSDNISQPGLALGLLSQNNTDIFFGSPRFFASQKGNDIHTPNYFADPDGVVRRAMGAFVPSATQNSPTGFSSSLYRGMPSADTTVGLPMARAFDWTTYKPKVSTDPAVTPYAPGGSPQVTSQAQSRPYFLHRPYRSVAELGHVFSDTPWRNLDFFTAESGTVALLDVFCVNDTTTSSSPPLVAGKVNLNTRQTPVLQAVLAGGYLDTAQPASNGVTGRLDAATAKAVAEALVARTTDVAENANGTGPLQNVSDLVGKWVKNMAIGQLPVGSSPAALQSDAVNRIKMRPPGLTTLNPGSGFYDGKLSYAGFSGGVWDNTSTDLGGTSRKPFINGVEDFSTTNGNPKPIGKAMDVYSAYMNSGTPFVANSPDKHNGSKETAGYIQRFREAPIRALAASGQTRVWNLMVDLVAQTGRYPVNTSDLSKFLVEGEQRYWVHLAIDRYTGNVIDKQIEVVKE